MTLPLGLTALQGFFCPILPDPLQALAGEIGFRGRLPVEIAVAGSVAAASRPG